MMQDISNRKRTFVILALLMPVFVIAIVVIDNLFLKAKIEVKTHDKTSVTKISAFTKDGTISKLDEIKKENFSIRVRPGEYEVRVEKPDGQINEVVINAKRFNKYIVDTQSYNLAQKHIVINEGAKSVFASKDILRYQKSDDSYFYELLRDHSQPERIGGGGVVEISEWFSDGSLLYLDENGMLHHFDPTSKKSRPILEHEGDWSEGDVIGYKHFDISPSDDSFAVITKDSRVLVFRGVQDTQPKDLGVVPQYIDEVSLNSNKVFVYSASEVIDVKDINEIVNSIIDVSTGAKLDIQASLFGASFSGDGKFLSYLDNNNVVSVVETNTGNLVKKIYSQSNTMFWYSDTELLYSDDEGLWLFDASTGYSKRKLATNTKDYSITSVFRPKDASTIYVTASSSTSNKAGIYRIELEPKDKQPQSIEAINSNLPTQNTKYSIDVVFFGDKPYLTINTYGVLNRESQIPQFIKDSKQYRQDALNYLEDKGININDVNIEYSPPDSELNLTPVQTIEGPAD